MGIQSTAGPLRASSNFYLNAMTTSDEAEQIHNRTPQHLLLADEEESDARARSVTLRGLFSDTTCRSCRFISDALKTLKVHTEATELYFAAESPADNVYCLAGTLDGATLYLSGRDSYIQPIDSTNGISIPFAHDCLRHCRVNHAMDCIDSKVIPTTIDVVSIYLIDLLTKSLVRASTKMTYVALSYVWGTSYLNKKYEKWGCSEKTLPKMRESGFFGTDTSRFPPTVLDAMRFTRLMGVRYLWIDRYCISQDNQAEKHSQLRAMGSIYYHTVFTIIAAEGDVSYGLRGLDSYSKDWEFRHFPRHCENISANVGIVYKPVTDNTLWSTRGWTFQEQIFARRCFIFRGETIIFKCQKCIWQEGTTDPISYDNDSYNLGTNNLTVHRWPNMLYFRGLVEEFCKRELTYPCDSLEAFGGVLATLEASFPRGFIYGLPEVCFDIALLWQARGILENRVEIAQSEGKPIREIPTWSWARWKGSLDFTAWEAAAESLFLSHYHQNFCIIQKIVDWQKEPCSSSTRISINNYYANHRGFAQDRSPHVLAGWKREPLPLGLGRESTLNRLLQSTNKKFTHKSLGGHAWFRFPIPLPTDNELFEGNQFWSPNIQGRVKSTHLTIAPNKNATKGENDWYMLVARPKLSKEDIQVGVVQIHCPKFMAETKDGVLGEFIALSAGDFISVPGRNVGIPLTFLHEWEMNKRLVHDNMYRFYNVMLIERRNGIAERRGLGRVEKSLWESMDLEEMEITLG